MQKINRFTRQWASLPLRTSKSFIYTHQSLASTITPPTRPRFCCTKPVPKNFDRKLKPLTPTQILFGRVLCAGLPGAVLGAGIMYFYSSKRKTASQIFEPPRFTSFTIVGREGVSPTSIVLTVRPDAEVGEDPYRESWERGTWSVEVKQPQLQIMRSYTPLPPRAGDVSGDLRFLIRREYKGEVSGYLHNLQLGGKVEMRGPNPEIDLRKGLNDVVFLAGGTGIAPALQVVHNLLERRDTEENGPRIRIIWANRVREDCVGGVALKDNLTSGYDEQQTGYIVRELQNLQWKNKGSLTVEYLVDEEGSVLDQKKLSQFTKAKSEVKYGPVHTRIDSKLLFVSGPEGFVNYFAGPKRWEGGKEGQGDVGGLIGKMGLRDWKVWKL